MSVSRCEKALKRLLAYAPSLPTSCDQKTAAYHTTLTELIRLAAAFAKEFKRTEMRDELDRRVAEFDSLTKGTIIWPRSYMEKIRWALPAAIVAALDSSTDEFTMTLHLSHLEEFRWDLQAAIRANDIILELPPDVSPLPDDQLRLVAELSRLLLCHVHVRVEGEHLLGCYLIEACRRAVAPGASSPDKYKALLERISADSARCAKAIQDAAEDLFHSSGHPSPPPSSEDSASKKWCHSPSAPVPPDFPHGPITGTKKYLASLICPRYRKPKSPGRTPDPRGIEPLGKHRIWIQMVSGQDYAVYFRERDYKNIYTVVNSQDMRNKGL